VRTRGLIALALAAVGLWGSGGPVGAQSGAANGRIGYAVFHDKGSCRELLDCSDERLWVVNPRNRLSSQLDVDCSGSDCDDSALAWSPSGREVAFHHSPDFSGLYVARADGSEPRRVTTGDHPTWSPDAMRFAFDGHVGADSQVFVVGVDGSGQRRLTYRGGFSPDWSSTDRIAFARAGFRRATFLRRRGIYTVNPDGSGLSRLTWRSDENPDWSPDGRWIALERGYTRGYEIALIRASGGRVRRLTHGGGEHPAWSPEGERIAFARGRRLMVLSLDSGKLRTLVTLPRRRSFIGLDWQPRP
jgi:Tol biopolymer transport system component